MLRELHISGLGVIDDLDIELHPGLNVLTGETGAGKTMVTVGLSLALGARATAALVTAGSPPARIQALFDAPPGAGEWSDDGELLLARTVSGDGKSSARIGGQLATASTLVELGAGLVEVHGQHQAERLLSASMQTAFLDRFAGPSHRSTLAAYEGTYARWEAGRRTLDELTAASRDRERELDLLSYQVQEIGSVAPRPGESEALEAELARLAHAERLIELAADAEEALGGDEALVDGLGGLAALVEDAARHDAAAEELARRARGLAVEAAELTRDIRAYREELGSDPARLLAVRERLASLGELRRKYGASEAEVLAFLDMTSERLRTLSTSEERSAELGEEVAALADDVRSRALDVSSERERAAPALGAALQHELRALGMPDATVDVHLIPAPAPGPHGQEAVELRFSASAGQRSAPLAKVASGGELSRTMLACRSVLADLDEVPTLVFDEVDAGIGGEAGLAVGRRLAGLAAGRQVLVVTHLPQIACFADRHLFVDKRGGTASVRMLTDEERIQELSRMLAGMTGSEGAVTHAEELLAAASSVRSG